MRLALRLGISAVLLGAVIWWAGPARVVTSFQSANGWWLLAMVLLVIGVVSVSGVNTLILTTALNPGIGKAFALRSYLRSFGWGLFAPSKFGDLSYAHYLSSTGVSHGFGLAVIVVDKVVSFSLSSGVAGAALLFYVGRTQGILAVLAAAGLIAIGVAALRSDALRRWVRQRLLGRHQTKFRGFSSSVKSLVTEHRLAVALNILLSVVRLLLQAAVVMCGFWGFQAQADLLPAVGILAIVEVITWIPITISGLGLTHGSATLLYSTLQGIDKAVVLDVFLLISLIRYALSALALMGLGLHSDPQPKKSPSAEQT